MVVLTSFTQPTDGIRHRQNNTTVYVNDNNLGKGTLFIAESRLSWVSDCGNGFSIEYPHISLHAVSRDLSAFPQECLFLMLDTAVGGEETNGDGDTDDGNENGSDDETTEIRLVPDDRGMLEAMFHAMNACQALHPDPEDSFSDEDFFEDADDEIPMEETDRRMAGLRIESMDGRLHIDRAAGRAGDMVEDMVEDMGEDMGVGTLEDTGVGTLGTLGAGMAGDTWARSRAGGIWGNREAGRVGDREVGRAGDIWAGRGVGMAGDTWAGRAVGTSGTLGVGRAEGRAEGRVEDRAEDTVADICTLGVGRAGDIWGDRAGDIWGDRVGGIWGDRGEGMEGDRGVGMVQRDRPYSAERIGLQGSTAPVPPAHSPQMDLEEDIHFDDAEN